MFGGLAREAPHPLFWTLTLILGGSNYSDIANYEELPADRRAAILRCSSGISPLRVGTAQNYRGPVDALRQVESVLRRFTYVKYSRPRDSGLPS